jgi:hypothetical protein
MVRNNSIQGIEIVAFVEEGVKNFMARIRDREGKYHNLAIADPDTFIYNLDQTMKEYSATGSPLSEDHKIEVK